MTDDLPTAATLDESAPDYDERVARLAKLNALVTDLEKKRDECVKAKRVIEDRWVRSLRQYHGMAFRSTPTKDKPAVAEDTSSTPKPHMTRSRADRWEARLCDMLFPANDLPWDLRPTPAQPAQADPMAMPGQPDPAQQADAARADADDRAGRMKRVVQDQLANCKFSRSGRRMIRDAVRIGCGLLMGPHRAICTKRKFRNGPMGMAIEIEETEVPEIREGDPWCFFPDMTVTVEKSEFAFYAHVMGKLEVRNLADAPGFDPEQVAALVQLEPDMGEFGTNLATRNAGLDLIEPTSGKYVVWRYTGVLNAEQLELLGCTCETGEDAAEGGEGDAPGAAVLPDMAMVDLWFSQGCVLRAKMTPIQNDYRIPYFVFSPFPSDDSMFGLSVPELCTDSQRVAESAWLIALVNASVSSGPLVISRRGKIAPRDGEYKLRGPKWIEALDDNIELNDTFAVHDFPNYVDRALQIFDRAMGIMDEELNTAQWGSTQNSEEAQTASGMAMLLNVRSILQVRVATAADDEIFGPIIERLYWWNMLYNPDDSIKGDYDVAPLVQSVRLVKDVQVQHLQAFTAMSGDPRFAPFVDTYALLKANAGMMDFPAMEFIKSREQAEAEMANKGPDPQALLAQAKAENEQARAVLAQVQAEAEKQRMAMEQAMAQLKMQAEHQDAAFRVADRQMDHEEAVDMAEIREREAEARVRVAELREETARMALAAQEREGAATVRAKLVDRGMQTEALAREMALKQSTGEGI